MHSGLMIVFTTVTRHFHSLNVPQNLTINEINVDGVLWDLNPEHRIVGTDESIELWWPS